MSVYDKNGKELNIGDTVHYIKQERTMVFNGKTKVLPGKDIIFTIDGFRESPFVKYDEHDYNRKDPLWVTGPELDVVGRTRNSVSPLALVKVETMVKKKTMKHTFNKPTKKKIVLSSVDGEKKITLWNFITQFVKRN
jgi:hypothetical protein